MRFVRKMRFLNVAIRIDATCGVQGGKHAPPQISGLPNNGCVATGSWRCKLMRR